VRQAGEHVSASILAGRKRTPHTRQYRGKAAIFGLYP
jgi:hypothetical protein